VKGKIRRVNIEANHTLAPILIPLPNLITYMLS